VRTNYARITATGYGRYVADILDMRIPLLRAGRSLHCLTQDGNRDNDDNVSPIADFPGRIELGHWGGKE
jgi:hypothetical protein